MTTNLTDLSGIPSVDYVTTRHPELMEKIRNKNNGQDNEYRRLDQIASSSIQSTQRSDEGTDPGIHSTESEYTTAHRTSRRSDEQPQRTAGPDVHQPESSNPSGAKNGKRRLKRDMTPEELVQYEQEKKDRDAERKRQNRALAKEAAELLEAGQMDAGPGRTVPPDDPHIFESGQAQFSGMDGHITDKGVHFKERNQSSGTFKASTAIPSPADIQLKWKGKQKTDLSEVKLITGSEAEDKIEKLTDLFVRGSGILDQVLQIIVKEHEEVNIWTLDDDTARIFASMKVEAAKKDKAAALEVRRLEAIHSKMFTFTVFAPRVVATVILVRQKGLGFR